MSTGPATLDPPTGSPSSGSKPATGGLKQAWGLSDPPPLGDGTNDKGKKFVGDFKAAIEPVNQCLLYTKINATKPKHDAMVGKRDQKYNEFPGKLADINKDEAKADEISKPFLDSVRALAGEANKLKGETEKSLNAWQAKEPTYTKSVEQLEELDKWGEWADMVFANVRKSRADILSLTNENKYDEAVKLLEQHLTNLKPLYEEYQKQKSAKEKYDARFKQLEPKLPKGSLPEDKMSAADQKVIADLRSRMESAAQAKDFAKALEFLESLSLAVASAANRAALNAKDDPEVIVFEGKELRADKDLLYKVLREIIETQGIEAASGFSNRLQNRPKTFADSGKREGLFPGILSALNTANDQLTNERKDICAKFEGIANKAAEGLLDQSKKTIEAELKRLGIVDGPPQVDSGSAGGTARPGYSLNNPEAAKSARKAANDLLPFAEAMEKAHEESKDAFEKFTEAQRNDPFNVASRPLAEKHEKLRKQWQEASEAYEKARRPAVGANPALAMFAEQPGVVGRLRALANMSDADFGNKVGEEAKRRLDNIKEVKGKIGGQFTVWKQPHLMRVTLDQMSAKPFDRIAVEWEARQKKSKADDDKKLFTLLALGLGLIAIGATLTGWGIGVAGFAGGELAGLMAGISTAAGGAGAALSLYQLGEQSNEYTLAAAANATDLEKAKAISMEEPNSFGMALNCVLAIGDVFAAAAAFKAIGPLVKAIKNGNVAAALKLGSVAESAGVKGAAKMKIVGEAVSELSGEQIVAVGKSMSRSSGVTEPAMQRIICASAGAQFEAELKQAMSLMENIKGRIPETARKMVENKKVYPLTPQALEEVYGAARAVSEWPKVRDLRGFYSREKQVIFLAGGTKEDVIGTLIHEATHRVGHLNPLRNNDFMGEAIAHFAERDFYLHIYGPNGPLYKAPVQSKHIDELRAMTDKELLAHVELTYRVQPQGLSKATRDLFKKKAGDTPEKVVEQVFADIAAHYEAKVEW